MRVRFEFKLADLWVGVFWRHQPARVLFDGSGEAVPSRTDVWVCLLPCLPLHLWWEGSDHA